MSKLSLRKYVGLPFVEGGRDFSGVDCYGVIVLIYREELGVDLWDTSGYSLDNYSKENLMLSNYYKNWEPIDKEHLQEMDVLLFTTDLELPDIPTHIALYVGENKMIHCTRKLDTHISKFKKGPLGTLFHSAYRYKDRLCNATS